MESNELRLGNLVYHDEFVCEITSVNPSEASYELLEDVDGYDRSGFWEVEWFKPIPLTEEWLVKFGFGKIDYSTHIVFINENFWDITYFKDSKTYAITDLEVEKLKYVHQLQNLYFCLTNTELKLSND